MPGRLFADQWQTMTLAAMPTAASKVGAPRICHGEDAIEDASSVPAD